MRAAELPKPARLQKKSGRPLAGQGRTVAQFVLLNAVVTFVIATFVAQYHKADGLGEWAALPARCPTPLSPDEDTSKALRNDIYHHARALADSALTSISPAIFANSIALRDSDGNNRKFLWDFYPAAHNCLDKEKVGNLMLDGDGGKWLCHVRSLLQRRGCVVYSIGSDGETSFEEGVLSMTTCQVHVFDPTLDDAKTRQMAELSRRHPRLRFHAYGIGDHHGLARTSASNGKPHSRPMPVKTLRTIMAELGHAWLDVLKVDVEGAEWQTFTHWLESYQQLPFTQLQVEYHYQEDSPETSPATILSVLQGLTAANLRVFSVEPNIWWHNNGWQFVEYAYIQVDAEGDVVTGPGVA